MSEKLKNILAFAELDIPLVPLAPGSDQPAVAEQAKATSPDTLRQLYKAHPNYNYGLVMGGWVFAMSVDGDDAKSWLRMVASESGDRLPATVTLRIGTRRYFLFRYRGVKVPSFKDKLGPGIDIHGEDAVIVGPACKLDSSTASRFVKNRALDEVKILKCPKPLWDEIIAVPRAAKSATKTKLLNFAKTEIEKGEASWRKAAEALARVEKEFGATQREMAKAIGRSASWVNRLLQWRRSGYRESGPFGPTTKEGRVAHAQRAQTSQTRKSESSAVGGGAEGLNSHAVKPAVDNKTEDSLGPASSADKRSATTAQKIGTTDGREVASQLTEKLTVLSPETAPENDIPADQDRRPLSPEDQRALDGLWATWEAFLAGWKASSRRVQVHFREKAQATSGAPYAAYPTTGESLGALPTGCRRQVDKWSL